MDDVTAEIKRAVDIVDVIGEYRPLEPMGSKFRILCPFHDDHKPSMVVDPKFQNYRCWACQAKGDVFTFVQEMEKISFVEAKERLAERAGITLHKRGAERSDFRQSLMRVLSWAQEQYEISLFSERTGAEARQYLRDRGLTEETARKHGLGFAPPAYEWLIHQGKKAGIGVELLQRAGLVKPGDRGVPYEYFRGRLMFPIRDERKRVLGFGGRILPAFATEHTPKYLNSPVTEVYNKSEVLYGIDVAAEELTKRPAGGNDKSAPRTPIVMEGYTDCLMAYQAGLNTAVATCGTALTPQHVAKLRRYADRVVLMFDGDTAGQTAADKAIELFLSSQLDLRLCVLPDNLDPCDFIREKGVEVLCKHVGEAPEALDYLISQERRLTAGGSIDEERRALEKILDRLSKIPLMAGQSPTVNLAIHRVAREFGQPEDVIRRRIRELRENSSGFSRKPEPVPSEQNVPMDPRERQIVQALVAFPGKAGEFRALFPVAEIRHPSLRKLMEACYELNEDLGDEATIHGLRERLDERALDRLLMELVEAPETWENPDQVLADIRARLEEDRKRSLKLAVRQHGASTDDLEEVEKLRQAMQRLREGNVL
ncbi:MAG: DNA primase [Planctomycetota bacterium]